MLHAGDGRSVKNEERSDRGPTAMSGAYRVGANGC